MICSSPSATTAAAFLPKSLNIFKITLSEATTIIPPSIGLRNTHCRLELFFGKPYGLSIRSVPDLGTSVTLRLPLLRKPFDFGKEESHDSSADC